MPTNQKLLDVPAPWPARLEIPKEKLEMGSPQGVKISSFKNARVESYAAYLRPDGLVRRVTSYATPSTPESVQETFENRKYAIWIV